MNIAKTKTSELSFELTSSLIGPEELSEKSDELYTITWNGINRTVVGSLLTSKELLEKSDELYTITWNGINRPMDRKDPLNTPLNKR